jgi:hypothetical protein
MEEFQTQMFPFIIERLQVTLELMIESLGLIKALQHPLEKDLTCRYLCSGINC